MRVSNLRNLKTNRARLNAHIMLTECSLGSVVFCLFLLLLTSCGNSKHRLVIGVSQCSEDNWRDKMNSEMLSAAYAEGNVELRIVSADDNSEVQKKQIEQFIDDGVDLLLVAPNQTQSISTVLARASERHIPVIYVDRKAEDESYTAFIGADNREAGRVVGRFLAQQIGGRGQVVVFQGLRGSSPTIEREEGLMEALKDFPEIELVNGGYTKWTSASAKSTIEKFINEHPDMHPDAIFGHNDRIAIEAKEAYLRRGMTPVCAGVDALPTADGGLRMVESGLLDASYLYPTRGDLIIKLAMKVLQGQDFDRDTYLSSTLITDDNASAVLTQVDDMQQMQQRITTMNSQIDGFLTQINNQRLLLFMAVLIVALIIFIVVMVFRMEMMKRQRVVQEANERLRFFTNVSHEFRTPLTLIADPLQRIAANAQLSTDDSHLLSLARRQVEVMLNLVNQILDLRKLQNGKMTINVQNTDLSSAMRLWADGFIPYAQSKGVDINLSLPQQLIVNVDSGKLERVVCNLLSNALKYSPKGTAVELSLTSDQQNVSITVSDKGHGMPSSEVNRIFERFYQTSSSVSGTGIGLALVKELVTLMHGTVSVQSEQGQGTTFVVAVPMMDESTVTDTSTDVVNDMVTYSSDGYEVGDAEPIREADEEAKVVLVVDDNADVRSYLRTVLQQADYRVIDAEDGTQGLKMAIEQVPDIIVTDVMMPVMNGHELCQALKNNTATSHVPILMLTAQAMEEQRVSAYEVGADSYISKPFSSRVLLARIANLLSNRQLLRDIFCLQQPQRGKADQGETASLSPSHLSNSSQSLPQDPSREEIFLNSFREQVEQHLTEGDFSVETLASNLCLSRVQMYRKIKALTGRNPVELIREARLLKADSLLSTGRYTASEVAYMVGFSSPSYFSKCYKEHFGHSPSDS